MWDDHDWLGDNQDSKDKGAAAVAKQSYMLGIPHYALGSSSLDEANSTKYQCLQLAP